MAHRVYKYGARRVTDKRVLDQMRLQRAHYNRLVEAENLRRQLIWGDESPPPPPHNDCKCSDCKTHWIDLRRRFRDAVRLDIKPLRALARQDGLYWGSYLIAEQAFAAAQRGTDVLHTLRFRSWRQGDAIAVQMQQARRHTTDRLFRIVKQDDPRTGRRAGQRHTVQIRIGSDEDRRPMFSEPIKIEMHRPMCGEIAWIHVRRKWIADHEIWSVSFTCVDVPARDDLADSDTVAVDVSWRRLADGSQRLAYAQDLHGNVSELVLSPRWAELTKRADRIRAHRDEYMNTLKAADPRFARVRSCLGVIRLAKREEIDEPAITAWKKRDRHLWQYECGCRRRSHAARRAKLAEWTRELRRGYAMVVIKDTVHKTLKEKKNLHRPARRQGHHDAPGEMIEKLCSVFDRHTEVAVVGASWTTAVCVACGHASGHGPELMITCERCGATYDRDNASTRNMLALHWAGEAKQPTARKRTARFAKRHAISEGSDNASSMA